MKFVAVIFSLLAISCSAVAQIPCDRPLAALRLFKNIQVVNTFFTNYGVIANWPEFMAQQNKILSPRVVTEVSDHNGTKIYQGPNGYFQSLGDWSKSFETGPDFRMEIVSSSSKRIISRLRGKIIFKEPIAGKAEVSDSQHHWTEKFTLDQDGTIVKIEVLMNLFQ